MAAATLSAFAPPPTSRKFAGSPPARLMRSIVVIASPAPLTMQPIVPSSLMNDRPCSRAAMSVGILLGQVAHRLDVGMATERRVIDRELRVEALQRL